MLEKVMQNGAKITKNDAKMVPTLTQNPSQINAKIDSNIYAKFVVPKSIKNRALERQRVAKVTSAIRWWEVSGAQGSLYSQKVRPLDSKTATLDKGSRHALGPKARRISPSAKPMPLKSCFETANTQEI